MNNDTKLLKIIEMCNFFLYIFSTNLIPPTGSLDINKLYGAKE